MLKIKLFIATCESVLLCGSEARTMTKAQEKSWDRTYTKMLRIVLGVSWKHKVRNDVLYRKLPKLSDKIGQDQEQEIKIGGTLH